MRVAIIGATGQLGHALGRAFGADATHVTIRLTRADLDLALPEATIKGSLTAHRPDVVINAAALTAVDALEGEPFADTLQVNALAPAALARACRALRARFVQVSTDYVFDGAVGRPVVESDIPAPLNRYAASKWAAEVLVERELPEALIVRVCGLYGVRPAPSEPRAGRGAHDGATQASGFPAVIVQRARAGTPLRVVHDQVVSPTYAEDAAVAICALVEADARGVVHVANAGAPCSWFDFAQRALRLAGLDNAAITPVSTEAYGAVAARPACSALACPRLARLRVELPSIDDALGRHLRASGLA